MTTQCPEIKKIFVAHSPCRDGNSALWVAWTKHHDGAEYLRESHGEYATTRSLLEDEDVYAYDITFLDICPPRHLLENLHKLAYRCEVWDHHKTAEEQCGDLPYVHIDQDKCGATFTFSKIYPDVELPFLLKIVEDGDTWRFRQPNSKLFGFWLSQQKFSYERWSEIRDQLESDTGREEALKAARSTWEFQQSLIRMATTRRKIHWLELPKAGTRIPAINMSLMQSEIGNALCLKEKHQGAAVYYRGNEQYYFSLRSTDRGPDVSEIATCYGGGGHRNASGFVVPTLEDLHFTEMTELEIESMFPELEIE